ncbi:MAG: MBL fold metallo-hydrolase [Bacteroidota bacterium]
MTKAIISSLSIFIILIGGCRNTTTRVSANLSFTEGDVNGAVITSGNHRLVVYGDPDNQLSTADMVLSAHARRDITRAGRALVSNGAKLVVPENELHYFTKADSIWDTLAENQFHDYHQKSTSVPTESIDVYRSVKGGDTIRWRDLTISVIDTRGYTEGAVSYLIHIDDLDVAFVGDLIYGEGQIMDIYSMQDHIPELKVWGYHGYAARMSDLIQSLERIAALNPDLIIPAHGPLITDPQQSISKLISRLRLHYQNYASVTAYRWHRGQGWGGIDDLHQLMAARVLPPDMPVDWMPSAETGENPPWLIHDVNSKLIMSEDGTGFLIDCGMKQVYEKLLNPEEHYSCTDIEGIFITHYHDDHTDYINEIEAKYNCPVYVTQELEDILNHPQAYSLPAMTSDPINNLTIVPEASSITWKEFTFTFYYFPGQTIYHDAMLVEKKGGEKVFFAGDSFSPTGVDDYCLQNRNLIQPGMGYLYCLDILMQMPDYCWIVSQHIEPPFRFTEEQLDFMTDQLIRRERWMHELFPWDNPNYGIDPEWARIYPYSQEIEPGQSVTFSVIILNHSDRVQEYTIHPVTGNLTCDPDELVIKVDPKDEGRADFTLEVPDDIATGNLVVTADIAFNEWSLREWCESILTVQKDEDIESL